MKLLFSFSLFILSASISIAQNDSLPERFNSPYEVIINHLNYLQEDNYNPAQAAKSLRQGDLSQEEIEKVAIEKKTDF